MIQNISIAKRNILFTEIKASQTLHDSFFIISKAPNFLKP